MMMISWALIYKITLPFDQVVLRDRTFTYKRMFSMETVKSSPIFLFRLPEAAHHKCS